MTYTIEEFEDAILEAVNERRTVARQKQISDFNDRKARNALTDWDRRYPPHNDLKLFTSNQDSQLWAEAYEAVDYGDDRHLDLPGIGRVTLEQQYGGMDQGSTYFVVFKVEGVDGEVTYVKRDGWYASHDGSYLEGPTLLVAPVTRTVTSFE